MTVAGIVVVVVVIIAIIDQGAVICASQVESNLNLTITL